MKKLNFIGLLFLTVHTSGQTCTINEIKLQPKLEYYHTTDSTIIYPVIVTADKDVSQKINDLVRSELIDSAYIDKPINEALNQAAIDGLISLSYSITFNQNGILSVTVTGEACRAFCSDWNTHFNFDLNTGQTLTMENLVNNDGIKILKDTAFKDKVSALTNYEADMKEELAKNEIDSSAYDWAMEEVNDYCINSIRIDHFSLAPDYIEIIDECEFARALQALAPSYDLKYSYKLMRKYIMEGYRNKLPGN